MSATTSPTLTSTQALLRAIAAAEHFRSTGALPSWATK